MIQKKTEETSEVEILENPTTLSSWKGVSF